MWQGVLPFFQAVNEVFRTHMPERYAVQMEKVRETVPDWVISGTAFTTITINRNIRTAAHYDKGDLKEGFGCIALLTQGLFFGGELLFPRYGVYVKPRMGAVLLADVHELHANGPMHGLWKNWLRLACVFYYRSGMTQCGTPQEEAERVNDQIVR